MRKRKCISFVATPNDILTSKAYLDLPFSARASLIHFLGKPKIFFNQKEYYTTEFTFSYVEAEKLGFAKATHARNIKSLIANGFIDPVSKGGLRGNGKSNSMFKLSTRYMDFGKANFGNISWESFH